MAANLRAMWPNFEAAGAQCLVVSGVVVTAGQRGALRGRDPRDGADPVPAAGHHGDAVRAGSCGAGGSRAPGSDGAASGLTIDGLREYGERAGRFAAFLDAEDLADFSVDTDDVPVPEVARRVLRPGARMARRREGMKRPGRC